MEKLILLAQLACPEPFAADVLGQCVCPNPSMAQPRAEATYRPPRPPDYGIEITLPCQFALPQGPREVGLTPDGDKDRPSRRLAVEPLGG